MMHDRLRTPITVLGLLVVTWALLIGVAAVLVRPQLAELERSAVQQSTSRGLDALTAVEKRLSTSTIDWSSWDDTYQFVADHNRDYLASNMTNEAISNLELNFVVMADTQGNVVYSKGVSLVDAADLAIPADVLQSLSSRLKQLPGGTSQRQHGLFVVESGTLAFSSAPILTSSGDGPARGSFAFAQYIDDRLLSRLAQQTGLQVDLYSANDATLPADVRAQIAAGDHGTKVIVHTMSTGQSAGYQVIRDAQGEAAAVARVTVDRSLFNQAEQSLNFYLLIAALLVLLLVLVNGRTTGRLAESQEVIDLKDQFFATASHELRTPLAVIRGNSQLARQQYANRNPQLAEMLDDISASSSRLIRMVTNYLDAARLEHGKITFKRSPLDIEALAEEALSDLRNLADAKGLALKLEAAPALPPALGDADRVKEVLFNLVGNAIKYTESGSITVTAAAANGRLTVSVTDTGMGITGAERKRLFGRYEQARRADTATGSGLGLYISRLLISGMGGSIWLAKSAVGRGATISFDLPVAE